ncbi:unnamed protein product [Arctia plantaginis]|uniref:Major facilitator superfamily (MFS) profile domain-containing protein n=1 Tax=Arctia plantaginis TaxID=874455 RepID=A0A8S1ARV6_ARCPL|nr:unnamed protein product [Arctia plantaginis]
MCVKSKSGSASQARTRMLACLRQTLMVVLINIPMTSFGLTMGWVSLASGESVVTELSTDSDHTRERDVKVVVSAAITFCASLVGVLLSARLLAAGRKLAVIVTSGLFVACWSLKLCGGGWWLVCARACAGLGGAGAWAVTPLLAKEMCSARVSGAAVSALVLASNFGELLMYTAAYLRVPHTTVLWICLSLSAVHCVLFLFMPESPQYLAAQGHTEKARESLAWLRGMDRDEPELKVELADLPIKRKPVSAFRLINDLFSDEGRRRAFILCCVIVVGQEMCGVLALMQFAERVFVIARDQIEVLRPVEVAGTFYEPALHAVLLGTSQLFASALSLYLVEKIGRKRLISWCGLVTGMSMLCGAAAVQWAAGGLWMAIALGTAVFADSAGLQPAPYAVLADMFDYEYRGCAVLLIAVLSWLGNAVEVLLFPVVVVQAGLTAALVLSAVLTLSVTVFALWKVPETRGRSTAEIYQVLLGRKRSRDQDETCKETMIESD